MSFGWRANPCALLSLFVLVLAAAACGSEPLPVAVDLQSQSAQGGTDPDLNPTLIASRPYLIQAPASYTGSPIPLLLAIHGMGGSGPNFVQWSGLATLAQTRGYLLAFPTGQVLPVGGSPNGWNASFSGLFNGAGLTDDVVYLRAVIADVSANYSVDADQVFVVGYSNGAFMANVMACAASDRVAAIVSIAGTIFDGEISSCRPGEPVAVMHTHGTADGTVGYTGGSWPFGFVSLPYVSADALAAHWVARGNCPTTPQISTADTDSNIVGDDTDVETWGPCDEATDVELWSVNGGGHLLSFTSAYLDAIGDFFDTHARSTTNTGSSQPLVCNCDLTTVCDDNCSCDPECDDEGCAATPANPTAALLILASFVVGARRRERRQ